MIDKEFVAALSFAFVGIVSMVSFAYIVRSCLDQFGG